MRAAGSVVTVLLVPLLLTAACGRDEHGDSLLAPLPHGIIEGQVRGPLGGIPVGLWLRAVAGAPAASGFELFTATDSAGCFRMAAPFGGYRLRYKFGSRESIEHWFDDAEPEADTIWLHPAQPTMHLDPRFAALRVQVPVPEGWAGGAPGLHASRHGPGFLFADLDQPGRVRDGRFEWLFPGLPPGRYLLAVNVDQDPRAWLPFGSTVRDADRVVLPPGGTIEVAYALPPPAVLSGEVRGSWERLSPLLNGRFEPTVEYFEDDSTELGYGRVDDHGRFALVTYRPGPLRILVENQGVHRWVGGAGFADATRFLPVPGAETTVPVEPESGVLFHWSFEGAPVYRPGTYSMVLYNADGVRVGRNDLVCDICSSFANLAGLANLTPGTYYALLGSWNCQTDWPMQWYGGAATRSRATPIQITQAGELLELDWNVRAGGALSGTVPDRSAWPAGAHLAAYPDGDTLTVACTPFIIILKSEQALAMNLLPGPYLLALRVPRDGGERFWWYPGTWSVATAESLYVAAGSTTTFGPWEFPK